MWFYPGRNNLNRLCGIKVLMITCPHQRPDLCLFALLFLIVYYEDNQVDARRLKRMIEPSPRTCLGKLHRLLPQLAATKQRKILDRVNSANNRLNSKPEDVSQFVSTLEFLADCNEGKDQIETEVTELQQYYALMESKGVQVFQNFSFLIIRSLCLDFVCHFEAVCFSL